MDDGQNVLVCLEVVYGRMEVVYQVTTTTITRPWTTTLSTR